MKKIEEVRESIEKSFRKLVQKSKVQSGFLLVHSEKLGIHLNVAAGHSDVSSQQPNYMASVGKIFTSVIVAKLYEQNKLSFDDPISNYLDQSLVDSLHMYKNVDYSKQLQVRHLLNHTSGLFDNFWPLLDQLLIESKLEMSPQAAIEWGKDKLESSFSPGTGFQYTDTNYHLLGIIVEKITEMPFHQALKHYIFSPLGMQYSSMLHYSDPIQTCSFPISDFYYKGKKLNDYKDYAHIDYAGGGVVAPNEDLLIFMKALTNYKIITKETLEIMQKDKAKYGFGIDYGYGIMQFKTVPLLMPKILNVWGHAGATGAFMFYHPEMDTYMIGTFNDFSFERKGVKFMMGKVIMPLSKCK